MTYYFKEGETIYWPNVEEPFKLKNVAGGDQEGGYYLEMNNFCAPEHGGTHVDAPSHFYQGKWRVHEIELDSLIGPVIKVDIKDKADSDVNAQLEVADLEAWEAEHGQIPDDVILLVYTGWGSRYPDRLQYLGTNTNDTSLLRFPGIHPEAAQWIVDNRKVKAIGIDTASLDYGKSLTFDTHVILFSKNIPGLENVANLDKLPTTGAKLYALPMKIVDGSGAPSRVFATGWRSDLPDPYPVDTARQDGQSPYLDLTYSFKEGETLHFPGALPFEFEIAFRGMTGAGFYYEANSVCGSEHGGTHMDAPRHMYRGHQYAHEVSLDDVIGPAVKIDIKDKADKDVDALMEMSDLEAWEEVNGRIPDDVILLVYSGWGCRWPNREKYFGTTKEDVSQLHFPGIHPDAAQWLVDNRKIKAVGIDTPSLDNGPSSNSFESHGIFFGRNISGFENVANLDRIPATGATVFALPLKFYEGSGAPARIIATGWSSDLTDPCEVGGTNRLASSVIIVLFAFITCFATHVHYKYKTF
ncbi:uncharacterized protein LOC144449280 [Glandiceps talaboti]